MKKFVGIILAVVMLICSISTNIALAAESGMVGGNITWSLNKGVLTLKGEGEMDPQSPWSEFCDEITEVVVDEGITSIGNAVFMDCYNMEKVTIAVSVKKVGQYAFCGCFNLSEVFYNGTESQWRSVTIATANSRLVEATAYGKNGRVITRLPSCGYNIDGRLVMELDEDGLLDITGTGPIKNYLLMKNLGAYVRSVVLSEGVTSICDNAFAGCDGMSFLALPEGLTDIGRSAFAYCNSLKRVYFPDTFVANEDAPISGSVFLNCKNLEEYAVYNSTNPTYDAIDGSLYSKDKKTLVAYPPGKKEKMFTVPSHVTTIGSGAFGNAVNMETLIIPEGVTTLDTAALDRLACKEIYIPASVKFIGSEQYLGIFGDMDIYYASSEEKWNSLIGSKHEVIFDGATMHFNASVQDKISVTLNGDEIKFDQKPVIENGRTLVPLRAIFEALGATVDWDNDTRTVTSVKGKTKITLTVGEDVFYVNGKEVKLDVPAKIVGNRTMVPARAVAESFGCKVDWDNDTRTVLITK